MRSAFAACGVSLLWLVLLALFVGRTFVMDAEVLRYEYDLPLVMAGVSGLHAVIGIVLLVPGRRPLLAVATLATPAAHLIGCSVSVYVMPIFFVAPSVAVLLLAFFEETGRRPSGAGLCLRCGRGLAAGRGALCLGCRERLAV